MNSSETQPTWQLDSIYPGIDSDAYRADRQALSSGLDALDQVLTERLALHRAGSDALEAIVTTFEGTLLRYDALQQLLATLTAYLNGFVATDAFDDEAAGELSSLQRQASRLPLALTRLQTWLTTIDRAALSAASATAREHAHFLARSAVAAEHQLPPEGEEIAAALSPSGGDAWARLHSALIGRHSTQLTLPERPPLEAGIAQLKNLQRDRDPEVRRRAFKAELALLERNEVAFAAALNAIKDEVNELSRRRGWESPLALSLFENGITPATLEAMHRACGEAFPQLRRYLKAKAGYLGVDTLAWHDLLAPVSSGRERHFGWTEAAGFVAEQFRRHWLPLGELAERAVAEGWIDVPPHPGKRNGAFCMGVPLRSESRILLNFGGSLDDVFTLAHELGHAYHNDRRYRAGRTALQGSTPMTLAETASIFCETIVVNAMLEHADERERLAILEQDLLGATQLVIDIHSRFLFERTVFDKRRERELSTTELRGIMLDAQAATYGDALRSDGRHPLMWAHKGHYYSSHRSFYNYPYTFGYLFGLGLYAAYRRAPEGFPERYDALLADTGSADAGTLARRFGIDLEDDAFWRSSLAILETRVAAYEALVQHATREERA